MRTLFVGAFILAGLALAGTAAAQEDLAAPPSLLETSADAGAFLPDSLMARVGQQPAIVMAFGGYDSAHETALFEADTEIRLWGPIAVRGGAVYTSTDNTLKPTVGLRVQLLQQKKHGIDAAAGVFYKPEGLTEPEGEIEANVAVGAQISSLTLVGNLVYGQDGEGNERDGEVRTAALVRLSRSFQAGLDGRMRFDLGSTAQPGKPVPPDFDLVAGPTATYGVGRVLFLAQAGVSVLKVSGATQSGVIALGGLGTAF